VLNEEPGLGKIKQQLAGGNYWVHPAPVVIAVATGTELDCQLSQGREYALFDTGMATMNLQLQAWHEGVYAHPMAGFNPQGVKEAFGISEDVIVITLLALGYPGSPDHLSEKHKSLEDSQRNRRPPSEVLFYNSWSAEAEQARHA
jgi:nitroreductase